ncbi:MAG: hypothetical protein R3C61_15820 [Bacteroidia bacterium]
MSRNLKLFMIAAAAAAFLGISVGLYMFNKPHEDVASAEADYSMSVDELFAAFSTDEATANEKYLNKIIEIEGVLGEKSDSPDGITAILSASGEMFGVSCAFVGEDASALNEVAVGSAVRIQGICTGYLTDVNLTRCVLK